MTRTLVLFLNKVPAQKGFHALAEEFDPGKVHELYRFLLERLITEVFPLEENYKIMLASDQTEDELACWLGTNWKSMGEHLDCSFEDTRTHPFLQAFKAVFTDDSMEKAICMQVGNLPLDESKLVEFFSDIHAGQLICGMGSDQSVVTLGLHRHHLDMLENLDFRDDQVQDLIQLRAEHHKKTCRFLPDCIIPADVDELTRFRTQLPEEHFLISKIDQMVLDHLKTKHPETFTEGSIHNVQVTIEPDPEIDES